MISTCGTAIATDWLDSARRARKYLLWTGRGASFALAGAFAASLRAGGARAVAVDPSEICERDGAGKLCIVSRSGRCPSNADLIVAEEGVSVPPGTLALRVVDPEGAADDWFPGSYLRAAIRTFARAARVGHLVVPQLDLLQREYVVDALVLPWDAGHTAALLDAAAKKLGNLRLVAVSVDEFGHGFHSRLQSCPDRYVVHALLDNEACPRFAKLEAWCRDVGVDVRRLGLGAEAGRPPARPLESLLLGLAAVESRCAAIGIDPSRQPLPASLDRLRQDVPAWT
jgi:hypothetical protein